MTVEQTLYQWLGRLLGLGEAQTLADFKFSFAAAWAQRAPLLLLLGCAGLAAAAAAFYFRHQSKGHRAWRIVLFVIRAAVLCQVLLLLAEPIPHPHAAKPQAPALWLLFDGTDSMNIADDLPPDIRAATDKATGIEVRSVSEPEKTTDAAAKSPGQAGAPSTARRPSRIEYLRSLVAGKDQNLLEWLSKQFRLQAFLFESTESVRSLELAGSPGLVDGASISPSN